MPGARGVCEINFRGQLEANRPLGVAWVQLINHLLIALVRPLVTLGSENKAEKVLIGSQIRPRWHDFAFFS
jgi:hypothetical protein